MNDSLIRKFCESPHRWLIVTIATVLMGLVLALPLVDDLGDNRALCTSLSNDLVRARQTADSLPAFEKRVAGLREKVSVLAERTVTDSRLGAYRSRIVDLVRASGCQIRRIDVGSTMRRPWTEGDSAITPQPLPGQKKTSFFLEQRSLMLGVDGSMREINELLAKLDAEATLAHARNLKLQSASREGKVVTMELELLLFSLARGPS